MRFSVVCPGLGFTPDGRISPGGLETFGRCVVRALASSPSLTRLSVWSQIDPPQTEHLVAKMIGIYAHPQLRLELRNFGGSRQKLVWQILKTNNKSQCNRTMYLHVNQSVLGLIPRHSPYVVWEIGRELFEPVSRLKYLALKKADALLSISESTNKQALKNNPGLPDAQVVHLCKEPPLLNYSPQYYEIEYNPALREPAIFILSRIAQGSLDKGHQELIEAWPQVIRECPNAQLWIGGTGDGLAELMSQVQKLPRSVARQIHFLGYLNAHELEQHFRRCRAFAMPSRREGFGLVFVEAAQYAVPAIGSIHDSVREIIIHEKTGLLVEQVPSQIAEACITLLTNDSVATEYGQAAKRRFEEQFTFDRFRERLLNALKLELPSGS